MRWVVFGGRIPSQELRFPLDVEFVPLSSQTVALRNNHPKAQEEPAYSPSLSRGGEEEADFAVGADRSLPPGALSGA